MLPPDAYLKGLAAATTLAVALTLVGPGRSRPSQWLGVFLGLVALNFGAETLRAIDPARAGTWFKLASVFAALDPAALTAFVSALRPHALPRRSREVVLAGSAALALWAGWGQASIVIDPFVFSTCIAVFTAAVYIGVLVAFVRTSTQAREADLALATGLTVIAFVLPTRTVDQGVIFFANDLALSWTSTTTLLILALSVTLSGVFFALAWTSSTPLRPGLRRGALLGAVIVALLKAPDMSAILDDLGIFPFVDVLGSIGRGGAAARWLFVGAFFSKAVMRDDAFGLHLGARRRAARVLVAVVFLLFTALVLVVAKDAFGVDPGVGGFELGVLLTVVVVSQGFRKVVDRVADRVYGVPLARTVAARQEAYVEAATEVVERGGLPGEDRLLLQLRSDLDIDPMTASVLERLAEDQSPLPLAPGRVLRSRYRIVAHAGKRGGARVFVARDLVTQQDVTCEEIHAEGDAASGATLATARRAGSLDHPHLVRVLDVVRRATSVVVVTQRIGTPLADVDPRSRDAAWKRSVVEGVFAGVAAAHAAGVVHGDPSPVHVLVTPQGEARVGGFALARAAVGETLAARPAFGGPLPVFAAPEVLSGAPATPASDVHALGRLALDLLDDALPEAAEAVLARAIDPDPAMRWPDAGHLLRAWREATASGGHNK